MNKTWSTCRLVCWALAILAGLVVFYWSEKSEVTLLVSLMAGVAAGSFIGLILAQKLCAAADHDTHGHAHSDASHGAASHGSISHDAGAKDVAEAKVEPVAAAPAAAEPVAAAVLASDPVTSVTAAPAPVGAVSNGPAVKSGTLLKGESELDERKGSWKYEAAPAPAAVKSTSSAAPAKPAVAASEDYDGDGKLEGKDEGTRPAALTAARGGKADDLKKIKGVGPKMEKMCNALGFYHFDQIAGWTADEVAWVDANLEGFKGRVSRDKWVEQAKLLATGGETEFSKRVDKGGVY